MDYFCFFAARNHFSMKYDIFISYSRHDSDVVNELVTLLEQEGYSIWIDRDGIESGEDFKEKIAKAIKESSVVLFFSSEHSNISDWTAKEIGIAVKYKKHIIPILLDNSSFNETVEFDLVNLDFVDYSKASTRALMREKLFKALKNKTGKQSVLLNRIDSKSKKNLWITLGVVVAVALVVWLAWPRKSLSVIDDQEEPTQAEIAEQPSCSGSYNGHDFVDLGLPNGTLWATCNIGANSPEEYGDYFAWGETNPKSEYSWNTYKYANGSLDKLTKYCNNSDFGNKGFSDTLTVLQPADDVANVKWGSGWQIPTKTQWEELEQNTSRTWTMRSGVKGWLCMASNGNSLFLPAAGFRSDDSVNEINFNSGNFGNYCSNSLYDLGSCSWCLFFDSNNCFINCSVRSFGLSVRPVRSVN